MAHDPTAPVAIRSVGRPSAYLVVSAIILGFAARLASAAVGDNYDMQSWWIVSEAVLRGEPVYSATHRYNYGPLWAYIIGALRGVASYLGSDTITHLHLLLTALLSLVDLALAAILYRVASPWAGVVFFLNPISIAVTGYHIQFDNFAILLGLCAWAIFCRASTVRSTLLATILFGASLSLKHVFSLYIGWLPFITSVRSLRARTTFAVGAVCVFLASFSPWFAEPAAWSGIKLNVFGYVSTEGHSLTSFLSSIVPGLSPRLAFIVLTVIAGAAVARRRTLHSVAPYLYLITLTALSSGMARNYLAIPVVGVLLFRWSRFAVIYLCVATCCFFTVNSPLGVSEVIAPLLSTELITYELAQVTLVALLIAVCRAPDPLTGLAQRCGSPQKL